MEREIEIAPDKFFEAYDEFVDNLPEKIIKTEEEFEAALHMAGKAMRKELKALLTKGGGKW